MDLLWEYLWNFNRVDFVRINFKIVGYNKKLKIERNLNNFCVSNFRNFINLTANLKLDIIKI
jgi:hypothetical protein